jgi:hypothetical protein
MGFKVDSSFLKFLTMGAAGVRRVAEELSAQGFSPIELERYCATNKIWATKVKRLRLPDLLCVRTGLRVEVRAKSDLKIRMSDAPANPDRVWDAGLHDDDVVALIACVDGPQGPVPADGAIYFTVKSLRESVSQSKLGPAKSASEGAERDRTWPSTVPKRPGRVVSVGDGKIITSMEGDGASRRSQTFALKGKHPYVRPGDTFQAGVTMLAGAPAAFADLTRHLDNTYDPLGQLGASSPLNRYAAVKALRFREELQAAAVGALEEFLDREQERRVLLEAAGSAAALHSAKGEECIEEILWAADAADMSMEAILVLTELASPFAREQLCRVATADEFKNDERRQAAVWGLGKAGVRSYGDLVPFVGDAEENVAYHAIAGFGPDTRPAVIDELVSLLLLGDPRRAPGASEALRVIGSPAALESLVRAVEAGKGRTDWAVATIGRLSPNLVRERLRGTPLLAQLEPMLLLAPGANWLAGEEAVTDLAFLMKQALIG